MIIAGAGGAAHLPGMVAAHTVVPVLGVPVQSAALQGLDSLLSIVQMPGGVPVGTMAIGKAWRHQCGAPGRVDPGHIASRIARQAARVSRRADREGPSGTASVMRAVGRGAALGVLGGGQLGRMFTIAARRMGYRVHTYSPEEDTPTGQVADVEVTASYEDLDALRAFARHVDVVTFEFENVPIEAIDAVEAIVPVRPSGAALHTTQQRAREKTFLVDRGFPTAPFARAATLDELWMRSPRSARPLSSRQPRSAMTGRDSTRSPRPADVDHIWTAIGHQEAIVEKRISLQAEISVDRSPRPRRRDRAVPRLREPASSPHPRRDDGAGGAFRSTSRRRAAEITRAILEELQYVGVLCVEFFLSTDGELLVNELAPRPHNSGHLTFDASVTSQFEQQVRAICGLPLGSTDLLRPSAMANLLGELWLGGEPNWAAAVASRTSSCTVRKGTGASRPQDGPPHMHGADGARSTGSRRRRPRCSAYLGGWVAGLLGLCPSRHRVTEPPTIPKLPTIQPPSYSATQPPSHPAPQGYPLAVVFDQTGARVRGCEGAM